MNDNLFSLPRLMAEDMSEETFAALLVGRDAAPNTAISTLYAHTLRFGWRLTRRSSVAIERRISGRQREALAE